MSNVVDVQKFQTDYGIDFESFLIDFEEMRNLAIGLEQEATTLGLFADKPILANAYALYQRLIITRR